LGILILLAVAIVALPAACVAGRDPGEVYLCFTPANASLQVGDSLALTATLQAEGEDLDRKFDEESGWTWTWRSDDGGEIEFSQSGLQWTEQGGHIYMAQVELAAVKAGTGEVEVGQPSNKAKLDFMGSFSCIDSCTITITTW